MNSILYTLFVHDATIEEENDTANYVVREYIYKIYLYVKIENVYFQSMLL